MGAVGRGGDGGGNIGAQIIAHTYLSSPSHAQHALVSTFLDPKRGTSRCLKIGTKPGMTKYTKTIYYKSDIRNERDKILQTLAQLLAKHTWRPDSRP